MANVVAPYSVYLLRCSDGSLYCGITTDVDRRVRQHNRGTAAKYTRSRRPVYLELAACNLTHSQALKLEYRIKSLPAAQKLRYLVHFVKLVTHALVPR